MKKWISSFALGVLLGTSGPAQPSIHLSIPLPPPIIFHAPPSVVILPRTQVYVVPDLAEEIFFYNGWWWRPWGGRWYRSHHYDRGWIHYRSVPSWYRGIPPGWREDYRNHRWGNGAWNHRPIPHDELHRNWKAWRDTRHWEQPQHRQHESHRGPHAPQPGPSRRLEPNQHDGLDRPVRGPDPIKLRPMPPPVQGHEDRGRGLKEPHGVGKPNQGRGGGPPGRPQEPRPDRR